jgi:hypothetical protein
VVINTLSLTDVANNKKISTFEGCVVISAPIDNIKSLLFNGIDMDITEDNDIQNSSSPIGIIFKKNIVVFKRLFNRYPAKIYSFGPYPTITDTSRRGPFDGIG